jgi:hypothetical protein
LLPSMRRYDAPSGLGFESLRSRGSATLRPWLPSAAPAALR